MCRQPVAWQHLLSRKPQLCGAGVQIIMLPLQISRYDSLSIVASRDASKQACGTGSLVASLPEMTLLQGCDLLGPACGV